LSGALVSTALSTPAQPVIIGQANSIPTGTGANYTGVTSAAQTVLTVNNGAVTISGNVPLGGSGTALDFAVAYVDCIIATKL
jgi:hypothetical protein